jgi:hypothetical protein
MTAADLTLIFALRKQRGEPRERLLHCVAKARDSLRHEDSGRRLKRDEGLLNLALQCLASICDWPEYCFYSPSPPAASINALNLFVFISAAHLRSYNWSYFPTALEAD